MGVDQGKVVSVSVQRVHDSSPRCRLKVIEEAPTVQLLGPAAEQAVPPLVEFSIQAKRVLIVGGASPGAEAGVAQ